MMVLEDGLMKFQLHRILIFVTFCLTLLTSNLSSFTKRERETLYRPEGELCGG